MDCHKITVDNLIEDYLSKYSHDPRLKDGMKYVLERGKRLRSIITLAIMEKLSPEDDLKKICLVPEFIHCSSLIIDDLPAFDNAKTRREKTCVHIAYGEGLAYLLSFNLVTEALLIVHKCLPDLKKKYKEQAYSKYEEVIYYITHNISGAKALKGQLHSTFQGDTNVNSLPLPSPMEKEEICDILENKTSSFFEIALILGWVVGGGDLEKLKDIQEMSRLLGLCYQIYDDFIDYDEDIRCFSHNYVYHRGKENAKDEYFQYEAELKKIIVELNLNCPTFDDILDLMSKQIL